MTDETSEQQSRLMAQALGLEELWAQYGGKTGFYKLVSPQTKKEVGEITKTQSWEEMSAAITEALKKG